MALRSAVRDVGDEGAVGLAKAGAIRSGPCRSSAEGGYPRFLRAALAGTPVSVLLDRAGIFLGTAPEISRSWARAVRAQGCGLGYFLG